MNKCEVAVWVCCFAMQGKSFVQYEKQVYVMGRTADP